MTKQKVFHKFKNTPIEHDGRKFPSKLEGRYYLHLKEKVKDGSLVFFLMQVPFHLPNNTKYICDFAEFHSDGTVKFVDTKGFLTDTFKLKKKWVESLYPVNIEVIKKW